MMYLNPKMDYLVCDVVSHKSSLYVMYYLPFTFDVPNSKSKKQVALMLAKFSLVDGLYKTDYNKKIVPDINKNIKPDASKKLRGKIGFFDAKCHLLLKRYGKHELWDVSGKESKLKMSREIKKEKIESTEKRTNKPMPKEKKETPGKRNSKSMPGLEK